MAKCSKLYKPYYYITDPLRCPVKCISEYLIKKVE